MILITGAGGKTGRALIKALSKAESLCAFVYRAEHISAVKALGAEKVIVGDLRNESSVRSAMEGVRAVYHVCPNMSRDEMVIGRLVIREARNAGVEHFLYHSVLHPQTEKMHHHWQKMRVEEMIFESGLPFTILQPAPYMQNLLTGWKRISEDGVLRIPYSIHSKFSFIDLDDIAEAVKVVLTEPGHDYAIYELAGTLPMSHVEVAKILSRVLNREVHPEKEDLGDWGFRAGRSERSPRAQSKRDEYTTENLTRMFAYYDQWGLMGNPKVLRWLLKREPTSVRSFVERIVKGNII
jgi:uncharacterized protein YbjT (DUF2867 family)